MPGELHNIRTLCISDQNICRARYTMLEHCVGSGIRRVRYTMVERCVYRRGNLPGEVHNVRTLCISERESAGRGTRRQNVAYLGAGEG